MPIKLRAKTTMMTLLLTALLILGTCIAGCGVPTDAPKQTAPRPAAQQEAAEPPPPSPAPVIIQQAKAQANTVPGVVDSTAVALDDNISLAVKVQRFDRLRLQQIREEVHQKITELAPGYDVHVTSDKKLFFELQQIELQSQREKPPEAAALKSKLEKINQKMRG